LIQPGLTLDLTKAIEIQHEVAKKLIEKHNNKDGQVKPVSNEKVVQLEQDNLRLTNMLQAEFNNFKLIKKDNNRLRNLNRELLAINQVLVESNSVMRDQLEGAKVELGTLKNDKTRVLQRLLEENPAAAGLDPESQLSKFLLEVKNSKPALQKANFQTSLAMQSSRDKERTKRQEVEGAKELAYSLKQDVSRLKVYQRLSKGKPLPFSEKRRGGDDDPKAWSFVEDQEKQENTFEAKRDTIETTHILDAL
jgi:hypothetical protein